MPHPKSFPPRLFCILALAWSLVAAMTRPSASQPIGEPMPKPTLEGGVDWINTAGPIHLDRLRGKIVLLDFWTYCCINCHHVLPDLEYLEEKYKDVLVVIGVHTAKFNAERDTANIRKKVAEYRIKHPVVNDANQVIWQRFMVQSWPTLIVIDPQGIPRGVAPGEGNREVLDKFIGEMVAKHKALGDLDTTPLKFSPESEKPVDSPLLYPGKVLADGAGNRLFIADTGHNRIVVTDLEGKGATAIGTGEAGLRDGGYDRAAFNRPQGMCLIGETLYVADTEDHAIRAVDLAGKAVRTVAGTGEQGRRRSGRGPALKTGLNSPWDVIPMPGNKTLAIAMAGPHQIWTLDLAGETVGVWAGSGREGILDGAPSAAEFAQPSGLATDGQHLFVADSEVSGLRSIGLGQAGDHSVHTIVGVGLFDFGDEDGAGSQVRLQHCLGLSYGDGKLFVADTYNNKVKVCDPKTRAVRTFVGDGRAGRSDDPARFDEPGGLSLAGPILYVADTNNHAIRAVEVKTKKVVTLALDDLKAPAARVRPPSFLNKVVYDAPRAKVAPGSSVKLRVSLKLPAGFKLNPEEPPTYLVETPGKTGLLASSVSPAGTTLEKPAESFTVDVPLAKEAADGDTLTLRLSLATFICKGGDKGLCKIQSYVWNVPVSFAADAPDHLSLTNAKAAAR